MKQKFSNNTCYYFVDEAGDTIIFGKKKSTRIGTQGASRFFFMGLLEVDNPDQLTNDLEKLRGRIFAHEELRRLPALQPSRGLTYLKFHATDDPPAIRKLVYEFLKDYQGLRFTCVLKDKRNVLDYVRQRQINDSEYRYSQGELYDFCARRIFRDRLHLHSHYKIVFAKWNKSERYRELTLALKAAKERFYEKLGIKVDNNIQIVSSLPQGVGGLQAVDYLLWALQRVYEKQDDSYYNIVASKYHFIVDIDDLRKNTYGMYYGKKIPLTLERVRGRL